MLYRDHYRCKDCWRSGSVVVFDVAGADQGQRPPFESHRNLEAIALGGADLFEENATNHPKYNGDRLSMCEY